MTKEEINQSLRNKLKDCDKETLIDIITDLCCTYVEARVNTGKVIQQCVENLNTDINNYNNELVQRINNNFMKVL